MATVHTTDIKSKQKLTQKIEKSNLKLNPIVYWMKKNKQHLVIRNSRGAGLFGSKLQKLQKPKHLEDEKEIRAAAVMANEIQPTEIIDLISDNESDSSVELFVPIQPHPNFTVEDSAHEDGTQNISINVNHEEYDLDLKPQQIYAPPSTEFVEEGGDKRLANVSICTPSCSLQLKNDFTGYNNPSVLTDCTSGVVDFEDLQEVDMDILIEALQILKSRAENENKIDNEVKQLELSVAEMPNIKKTNDSLEFGKPKTSELREHSTEYYRVKGHQFKCLDVYESEADITDDVHARSAAIRVIDFSSEEAETIGIICTPKAKRLRKRRAFSSNREYDAESGSDDDDFELLHTQPEVKVCKPGKRNKTEDDDGESNNIPMAHDIAGKVLVRLDEIFKVNEDRQFKSLDDSDEAETIGIICTPKPKRLRKRRAFSSIREYDADSDSDDVHIKQLHTEAEVKVCKPRKRSRNENEGGEFENIPIAHDIAAIDLVQQATKFREDMAVPEDRLSGPDEIFKVSDSMNFVENKRPRFSTFDNVGNNSNSSDNDIENFNGGTQIIKIFPIPSTKENTPFVTENSFPIYYGNRGQTEPGSLSRSTEMRSFYNDSSNGEYIALHKAHNTDKYFRNICTENRFKVISNERHENENCSNCYKFGHLCLQCIRPKKSMTCCTCGERGNFKARCPYTRRVQTELNGNPNDLVNYNRRKYCSICGDRAHLSENCRRSENF